jgi:TolA-binding protein
VGPGALINRVNPLIKGLTILTIAGLLPAQETTPLSEIFFLDLGIVIEPSRGFETYSRLVKKPSQEVSFKIKKVESGSIYMASSKELLSTLGRINTRIKRLENSFQTETTALKQENVKLRNTLAEIQQSQKNINRPKDIVLEPTKETKPFTEIVENLSLTKSTAKPVPVFNHSTYMTGVFAYQREDYHTALNKFLELHLDDAPKKTTENILYWMADAYQQTGQYDKSLSLLNTITTTGVLRIDDALVQKGLLHRKMGDENLAMIAFSDVVSQHPNSEYLRLVQLELKKFDETR